MINVLKMVLIMVILSSSILPTVAQEKRNVIERQLEKQYQKKDESVSLKNALFLLDNSLLHFSQNYYLEDSLKNKVFFDELGFETFKSATEGLEVLKQKYGKLTPVAIAYPDIDTINSGFIINHTNAISKISKANTLVNYSDTNTYREFLLPYRSSIEPFTDWIGIFNQRFNFLQEAKTLKQAMMKLKNNINSWFVCTYNLEKRNEPLARLSALQLLTRKKGTCEDVANLVSFALRSQGIATAIDYVPAWATSSGNHTLNAVFANDSTHLHFDVLSNIDSVTDFVREPGKVIRYTFSPQQNTLANFEKQKNIPDCFLQLNNYIDVTAEYWDSRNLASKLSIDQNGKTIYACVLNFNKWTPIWWGRANGNQVLFSNMGTGAVYLPMVFENGKLKPTGFPSILTTDSVTQIVADTINRITLEIPEKDKYLHYKKNATYNLYYWNERWKLLATKTINDNNPKLIFENVPDKALFILISSYSNHKERPFTLTSEKKLEYW